ncbi:hypothetical protein GCM10011608_54680 [Micromonospora sonchi]|uniref:DUF4260 domain-containing protein n=1 Tax=Micromonospora sonchi TaxID=1763543 RepID=A0A917U7B8_9ACTN|nr:DUF4260 family protein [Micromonospora sonchi]GGM62558.1 hypothetical protein GCM10011608_54680 [Micromonospora sonchi]
MLPAMLGAVAVTAAALRDAIDWLGVLAIAWAFHIAIDRALGCGLKMTEGFGHTHLGPIGTARPAGSTSDTGLSGGLGACAEDGNLSGGPSGRRPGSGRQGSG